jgi:hypothetical protein
MTFIDFFAIGLEGEGETIRWRGDLSVNLFRGDFSKESVRSDSPDEPIVSRAFFLLEGEGGTTFRCRETLTRDGFFVIFEVECVTEKNDLMLPS